MKPTPDLYDRLRADTVRASQRVPRRGNNPWATPEMRARDTSGSTYHDPTASEALYNLSRESNGNRRSRY